MLRHPREPQAWPAAPAARTVRVLRGEAELAEASARAAVHARRLHDRLEARAARDAWMAEHHGGDRPNGSGRRNGGGLVRTLGPATGPSVSPIGSTQSSAQGPGAAVRPSSPGIEGRAATVQEVPARIAEDGAQVEEVVATPIGEVAAQTSAA